MDNNVKSPKRFTIKFYKHTLGIEPGVYNVTESNKGYRLWLKRGVWIGLPKGIVEGNPKLFRPQLFNPKKRNHV